MSLFDMARRFHDLRPEERGYFLRRFIDQKLHARAGFAQFGEDASVAWYLRVLGRSCRRYIDIGANDPVIHSNTYLFYRDGGSGVLVEANPDIARRIARKRPRDLVVNVGVLGVGGGRLDLHVMDMDGLSTLSDARKDHVTSKGIGRETRTISVPIVGINDLLHEHLGPDPVDFASIDIEGPEPEVLEAWDFDRWRPLLFCAETTLIDEGAFVKDPTIGDILRRRGYRPLFETFANTIFVDERA